MNRSRVARIGAVALATAALAISPASADHAPATEVRGGYFNTAGCVPVHITPPDETGTSELNCTGGSVWNGDLTGHTVIRLVGHAHTSLRMWAEYEELFVGRYVDGSVGGLYMKGTAWLDENGAFHAEADIVGSTCAWAGSTGSFRYDGHALNGGYIGTWHRPANPPATGVACNPADPIPQPPL